MLRLDPAAYQVFRRRLVAQILSGQVPASHTQTGAYWKASTALASAGLEKSSGEQAANFHDLRLEAVLKPSVRKVALLLDNFGPLYEREVHRCLGYNSRTAVWRAIQALEAAEMIQQTENKKWVIAEDCKAVSNNPADEMPQPEYRAAFTDMTKALKGLCETAILVGDFAEGKGSPGGTAEVLVMFVPGSSFSMPAFTSRLLEIAGAINAGYGVTVHQTVASSKDFICFLHSKRGVWPGIFVRAGQGILLTPFRHDGEALFSAVQGTLTYSEQKIQQLLKSGTMAQKDNGSLFFTELGVRRYVRLAKPPTLHETKPGLSILGPN